MAVARVRITCPVCGREYWAKAEKANSREAQAWETYISRNPRPCPECYAAQKAAERAAEIAATKAATPQHEAGCPLALPVLQGSDNQASWARDIRAGFLAAFAARGAQWDNIQQAAKNPKIKVELDKLLNPSARWWIDHRNTTIFGIDRIDVPPVTETPAPVVPPVTEACKQEEIAAAKKQADAEREAKIGISPLRAWIDKNHPNAKWNSRVYGSAKYGYSVYLDSRSASIPTQIWAEYEKWLKRKNEINAETVPVAPASAPVAPVAETVPVASAPMPVYDRPMTMPMIRSINDVRRSVCLQAWTLIRQGADKSSAFKAAWKTIKTL